MALYLEWDDPTLGKHDIRHTLFHIGKAKCTASISLVLELTSTYIYSGPTSLYIHIQPRYHRGTFFQRFEARSIH